MPDGRLTDAQSAALEWVAAYRGWAPFPESKALDFVLMDLARERPDLIVVSVRPTANGDVRGYRLVPAEVGA